jgi:hypothetical protein
MTRSARFPLASLCAASRFTGKGSDLHFLVPAAPILIASTDAAGEPVEVALKHEPSPLFDLACGIVYDGAQPVRDIEAPAIEFFDPAPGEAEYALMEARA